MSGGNPSDAPLGSRINPNPPATAPRPMNSCRTPNPFPNRLLRIVTGSSLRHPVEEIYDTCLQRILGFNHMEVSAFNQLLKDA